jgi:serine phosphatase RsbU (regulator of sigma subunit)
VQIDDVSRWAPSDDAARAYGTLADGRRVRSYIAAPVRASGGDPLGVLILGHPSPRAFRDLDRRMAWAVAAHLAVALEKAALLEERDHVAKALQENLLPPLLPAIQGVDIAARYRPTGAGNLVGGDFYDVLDVGDGAWAIVLGDVSGVGPEAAAVTGLARYTIRAVARQEPSPAAVLQLLNDAIGNQRSDERFCTAVLVRFTPCPQGLVVTLASGGHPPAIVVRDTGEIEVVAAATGTLLGLFPTIELTEGRLTLAPGDALVLYTDGVVEARSADGEQLGQERLEQLLASCAGRTADGIARRVELAAIDHQGGDAGDDVAVVVLRAPVSST